MNSRWERALINFKQSANSSFEKSISKYFVKIRNSHFASLALIGAVTLTTLPLTTSSIADLQLLSPARADSTTFDAIQEIEKFSQNLFINHLRVDSPNPSGITGADSEKSLISFSSSARSRS